MRLVLGILVMTVCALGQPPYITSIRPAVPPNEIPINRGSTALWQSLKKLHTWASLIMITAHPDDEDGGMLTYESRGRGSRVTLLTLNRGEGGANVMSPDYFDALGLVRTQELLAADRYYGVDQYWTRVIDYGFSKTEAESMAMWNHDRVLYDVVRVLRMVRPLVVTSVFVGKASDGHGNHQAAGALAQEAFHAAGDPNSFPDQIKAGLQPWSPLKDYAQVPFARSAARSALIADVEVPEGTYDPVLGLSYLQISREGLGCQKSQNGGSAIPDAGQKLRGYHRFASIIPVGNHENSVFDGIDTSLSGMTKLVEAGDSDFLKLGLNRMNDAVEAALAKFSANKPEAAAPALAAGLKTTITLMDQVDNSKLSRISKYNLRHELEIKRVQFNNALAEALGLSLSAKVAPQSEPNPLMVEFMGDPETFRTATPGQSFGVNVETVNQSSTAVTLAKLSVEPYRQKERWTVTSSAADWKTDLVDGQPAKERFIVQVPFNASFTRPYYSRPNIEQSYYDIADERFLNLPYTPYPLAAWADFNYRGVAIRLGQYVQTVKRITGVGTVFQPLVVGPAVSVAITPRAGIVPLDSKSFPVTAVLRSNVQGAAHGHVRLELPPGWTSNPTWAPFATTDEGQDQSVIFQVTPAQLSEKPYQITAVCEYNGRSYKEGYEEPGYSGLRPPFLYRRSTYSLSGVNVKTAPDLKVGYVMGSGDDVPASLDRLGVHVTMLGKADIAVGDLSRFDVVLLGVRTYAAREDLRIYNARLLSYVHGGGVVIVQYNTPEFDHNYGPFPYTMGTEPEEVTDERSKVEVLEPSNPIFNWPNKISERDFEGWIEERGSKWMTSWDPRYHALLETHDENQPPQKGGLLYAKYGSGIYIYNAYAFYRELPEGVPGAYRLFANMISLPKNPQR